MEEVIKIIKQLQNTSGTNDKIQILKDNKDNQLLKDVLYYTYNPFMKYGMSEKTINPINNDYPKEIDIFHLLHFLAITNINDKSRHNVNLFLGNTKIEGEQDLYIMMILKDLRCNISTKLINKAIPKLIPEFKIQQAYPIDKYRSKLKGWFALETKENGINGSVLNNQMISRQGKVMEGFDHIINQLNQLGLDNYYFNGELVRKNVNPTVSNGENFRLTTSIVNSDDIDKSNIDFILFDAIPIEEFYEGQSKLKYKDRLNLLKQIKQKSVELGLNNLDIPHIYYEGEDQSVIDKYLDMANKNDEEGLMYIKDCIWKNKRHSGILKVKSFKSADCEIVGYEEGTGRLEGMLGSFIINYKNNKVKVGSGYSDEQRNDFWKHKDEYIGRILEVKFKEETMDKKTKLISLQFPTFVCIREEGKKISYN